MESFEILFVDDDRDILSIVESFLSRQGFRVQVVDSGLKALKLLEENAFDLVLTDLKMPEFSGLDLLAAIKRTRPETEVVIVTGYGTTESAIQAMKLGCFDYLQKPFKLDQLKGVVDRVIEQKRQSGQRAVLMKRGEKRHRYDDLVGISPRMQMVYASIDRISLRNPFALIQGESGTGKELVARVIHKRSQRRGNAFHSVKCGSMEEKALASRLFDPKEGLFYGAMGSTIFLDEIAQVPPALQTRLLKVLVEQNMCAGEKTKEPMADVGMIAASSGNLEEAVARGAVREDLYRCLNRVSIALPPLRERKEDICLLINHFLDKFISRTEKRVMRVSSEAMDILLTYHWPGNVIQLENVIERAFALGVEETIHVTDLPSEIRTFGRISGLS